MTRMPDGRLFPPFGAEHINNIRNTKVRPDDVFVCGYPKTGCHWIWETIAMIRQGKADYSTQGKLSGFLELVAPEVVESLPSPRVLNTHGLFSDLPDDIKTYKCKIVFTIRNPKDVAVSHYCHHIKLGQVFDYYKGEFKDWIQLWLQGQVDYGSFLDFHKQWDKAIGENSDHPILIISFEDMKRNLEGVVGTLAAFLEVKLTNETIKEIADAATFDSMKENYKGKASELFIRKGEVGDWKNWFTDVMSEEVDKWKPELDKTRFTFTYT
ncbi:sulfotransferase 1B1-like isoform X2 [Physella acuta]|nr:sulfotransferase 1B1-like isoform X2 [Physella acuta]